MSQHDLVVLTLDGFRDPLAAALAERGVSATILTAAGHASPDVPRQLPRADALVSTTFRAAWVAAGAGLPRLRLIQVSGAGTDGIDLDGLPEGVTVCNVFGHERAIAEHVFMVLSALDRNLLAADRALRQGRWANAAPLRDLAGRTLCIVGLGRTGRELARWGAFHGMRLVGATRSHRALDRQALGLDDLAGLDELPRLAAMADFLVVTLPSTPETDGLVDGALLAVMRPSAYLVNVGRGPVVDEHALYSALRDGRLAGAAIDVWYRYPEADEDVLPSHAPLHELPTILMTPHQSGYTEGTMRHRWAVIARNLERLRTGGELDHVVRAPRGPHA